MVSGFSPLKRIYNRIVGTVAATKYFDLRRVMHKQLNVAKFRNKELHAKLHSAQMCAEKYCTDFKKSKQDEEG